MNLSPNQAQALQAYVNNLVQAGTPPDQIPLMVAQYRQKAFRPAGPATIPEFDVSGNPIMSGAPKAPPPPVVGANPGPVNPGMAQPSPIGAGDGNQIAAPQQHPTPYAPTQPMGPPQAGASGMASPYAGQSVWDNPETVKQVLAMGGFDRQQQELDAQRQRAMELRDARGANGIQAGRVYVASSPFSHLGAALKNYAGLRKERTLDKRQTGLNEQRTSATDAFAEALRNARNGRKPLPPTPERPYYDEGGIV